MSLDYIRDHYGVPAKRGRQIRYTGGGYPAVGDIVGARGQYLRVRFVGDDGIHTLHPTWKVEYLAETEGNPDAQL